MDMSRLEKELATYTNRRKAEQRHRLGLTKFASVIPEPTGVWWWRKCPKCKNRVIKETCFYHYYPVIDYYKCIYCDYERAVIISEGVIRTEAEIEAENRIVEQKRLTRLSCQHSPIELHETTSTPSMSGIDYHENTTVIMCSKCGTRL